MLSVPLYSEASVEVGSGKAWCGSETSRSMSGRAVWQTYRVSAGSLCITESWNLFEDPM